MNQLIAFYNGLLSAAIMCYIIYRINTDLKRPSIYQYLLSGFIIAVFSSQIPLLISDLNNLVKVILNFIVILLSIRVILNFNIFYSLISTLFSMLVCILGDVFASLVYVYPLRISVTDFSKSVFHITIGDALIFLFCFGVLKFLADNFIRLRRRLFLKHGKLAIVFSANIVLLLSVTFLVYNIFPYYLEFRKNNVPTSKYFFNMTVVWLAVIVLTIATVLLINQYIFHQMKYRKLKMKHIMDSMTDTLNRESGINYLKEQLKQCRESGKPLTICYIDINNLKGVNDTFGHGKGDSLLLSVVETIKANIRDTDCIFRLGGDEFAVVFPGCGTDHAREVIERVGKELTGERISKGKDTGVSFSYGLFEQKGSQVFSAEEILDKADREMYINKRSYYDSLAR